MQALDIDIHLGTSKTGLSLKAQLVDSSNAPVGSEITTGFSELGNGDYMWHYASFPDDFRGAVKFYKTDGTYMASTCINPTEIAPHGLDLVQIESGVNARQALSIMASVLAGVLSGANNEITIRAIRNPSVTRVVAQTTTMGERTNVTLNIPA